MKSPGVTRNFNFSKSFEKLFKKVTVFTTSNREVLPEDSFEIPKNIDVIPVHTSDYRTWTSKKRKNNSLHFDDKKKASWVAKFGIKLIDTFPFNILLGEGGLVYVWKAYFKIKKYLKQNPNSVIYSSFRPYADLYIAYLLKKSHPEVKWVADFRDLHVEPIYKNVFFPQLQIIWNRRMLKKADIVTSVSQGLVDQLKKYNRPSLALLNGVTIRDKEAYYDKFTISYTGSLFKNERDPSLLFNAIRGLLNNNLINSDNFQIIYAGKDGAQFDKLIKQFDLSSLFINHNMVSRKEALSIQTRSHFNLLLSVNSHDHSGVLTGKLFEYLGALNSILLIMIGNYDEEFETLFSQCNAGRIFYTEEHKKSHLEIYLKENITKWHTDHIAPTQMNEPKVSSLFSWDKSSLELLEKLKLK